MRWARRSGLWLALVAWALPVDAQTQVETSDIYIASDYYASGAADLADTGVIRLGNTEIIAWEASPAGTDITLSVDVSEILQASGTFNAVTLTESANAVPNATDHLGFFAATTSAQLAGVLSNETGSGLAVFATTPVFTTNLSTPLIISPAALGITPASGSNLNVTLATTGDFVVNTNDLVVDTSSGNVGIGTTGPVTLLTLVAANPTITVDASAAASMTLDKGVATSTNSIGFFTAGVSKFYIGTGVYTADETNFDIGNGAASLVRIQTGGNVGIGTTGPAAQLETRATTEQLRVSYDANNRWTSTVNATGTVAFDAVGSTSRFTYADTIQHPSYTSQISNWRITDVGEADFRYLFTDELHAKVFIADLEQALAGLQIIPKSVAMVAQLFTCPAAAGTTTLWVRDLPSAANMAFGEANDWVSLRTFSRAAGSLTIADCVGTITAYADGTGANEGQQSWTFTRGSGGSSGTMVATTTVAVDSLVLDYGVSGNGYHEINSIDGVYALNSPYSQIVTWTTAPVAANRTVRVRVGNQRGITGTANEFGFLATGPQGYAASDGQYILASNEGFNLHGIDLTMWEGATSVIALRRNAGSPYFAIGSPFPTAFTTGTGIWAGLDGGVYKFRAGTYSAGNQTTGARWDGTNWLIGESVGVNVNVSAANGIEFRTAGTTVRAQLTGTTWTLGATSGEHAAISATAFQLKNGATVNMDLTGNSLSIGNTVNEHLLATTTAVQIKDGATVYTEIGAGLIRIGPSAQEHLELDGSNIRFETGAGVEMLTIDTTDGVNMPRASSATGANNSAYRFVDAWTVDTGLFAYQDPATQFSWIELKNSNSSLRPNNRLLLTTASSVGASAQVTVAAANDGANGNAAFEADLNSFAGGVETFTIDMRIRPRIIFEENGTIVWDLGKDSTANDDFWIGDGVANVRLAIQRTTGNVGIGTTGPRYLTELFGSAPELAITDSRSVAANTGGTIGFDAYGVGTSTLGNVALVSGLRENGTSGNYAGMLLFYTNNGSVPGALVERIRIDSSGNVGIGATPARTLHVAGTIRVTGSVAVADDRSICTQAANGDFEAVNGACGTSSIRYKERVQDLGYGLDEVLKLRPVFFNYLKDAQAPSDLSLIYDRTKRRIGFVAEDMQQVIPEVVIWQEGQIENIDYPNLTALLVKGMQEMQQTIDRLEARLRALERQ